MEIIKNPEAIISAIDAYIEKSDKNLENELRAAGYVRTAEAVALIGKLQNKIAGGLRKQTKELLRTLKEAKASKLEGKALDGRIQDRMNADDSGRTVEQPVQNLYRDNFKPIAGGYMSQVERSLAPGSRLTLDTIRERTRAWWTDWSKDLSNLMRINSQDDIWDLIYDSSENGESLDKLMRKIIDGGWRSEYYQARRTAITEVLRLHSVAADEAIQQNPDVEFKEWAHTGAHKNEPRLNHISISGQRVPKDQPYTLVGKLGGIYNPMYPRDPCLPPEESINCHCISRAILGDLGGLSYDERRKMKQDHIKNDDREWMAERDKENRDRAGINPDRVKTDWFEKKTDDEKAIYLGGKKKMELYRRGYIDTDTKLDHVRTSTLKQLRDEGLL